MPTKHNKSLEGQTRGTEATIAFRTRSKRKRNTVDRSDVKTPSKNMHRRPKKIFPPRKVENAVEESPPPLECGICLDSVKTRGVLDSCNHVFCFACIIKWTKRSSSCPHCKREVVKVTKTEIGGKTFLSSHVVKKRALRDTLDREEFQQRRGQFPNSSNRRRTYAFDDSSSNFNTLNAHASSAALNTDVTRHLFNMHQLIRDNMNRVSSSLRGLQDNLNSLTLLNVSSQSGVVPMGMGLCNFPGFANINVTVNGFPQNEYFSSSFMQQGHDSTMPLGHDIHFGQRMSTNQQPQLNAMNYYVPYPMLPRGPLFSPEVAQTLDNLTRYGHAQFQNMLESQGLPSYPPNVMNPRGPDGNLGSFPQ